MLPRTIRSLLAATTATTSGAPPTVADVHGWVATVRLMKSVAFVNVNDGTTPRGLQVVAPLDLARRLTVGTSVRCKGRLVPSPGREQSIEMEAASVEVLGECPTETYPLQKKAHSREFLREISHLRPRSRLMASVLRLRHEAAWAIHSHLRQNDFTQVNTPIITSTDCEGAGEMFNVQAPGDTVGNHFFGVPAFLTVSGQLQAEILASALSRVYTLGPTFRAENSQTTRHLAEFWMLEAEVAFVSSLKELNNVTSDLLHAVVRHVLNNCRADLDVCAEAADCDIVADLENVAKFEGRYESMTYTEALSHLQSSSQPWRNSTDWGNGLHIEHERFLADQVAKGPVFVTDYPTAIKPFYMRANATQAGSPGETVAAVDLLVPRVGELVGGSLREERLPVLETQMARCKLPKEAYQWYLDLRRFGTVPHGGFGMGFERLLLFLTHIDNIRDVVPFPRHPGRCQF